MPNDPSASSSSGVSAPDFVPENQSQGISLQTQTQQSLPPPPQFVPPRLFIPPPQHLHHPPQPQPHPQDAAPPPEPAAAPAGNPGGLHPDLMLPLDAPYARYTVEDLLQILGRKGLPIIDPDRPLNTVW